MPCWVKVRLLVDSIKVNTYCNGLLYFNGCCRTVNEFINCILSFRIFSDSISSVKCLLCMQLRCFITFCEIIIVFNHIRTWIYNVFPHRIIIIVVIVVNLRLLRAEMQSSRLLLEKLSLLDVDLILSSWGWFLRRWQVCKFGII